MKAAEASIKLLLDNPSEETSELIKKAQAEYKGWYHCGVLEYGAIKFYSHILLKYTISLFSMDPFSLFSPPV